MPKPIRLTPKVPKSSLAKGESDGTIANWNPNNLDKKASDYLEKRREINLQTKIEIKQKKIIFSNVGIFKLFKYSKNFPKHFRLSRCLKEIAWQAIQLNSGR